MNWWLAYNVAIGVGLVIALGWAWDARRYAAKGYGLIMQREQPTEEIQLPQAGTRMRIGPRLEEFGPGKPVPRIPASDPRDQERYKPAW